MRRDVLKDEFIEIEDSAGLNESMLAVNKEQMLLDEFSKIASLIRHGKFEDVQLMMSMPDFSVPVDYQDMAGNTMLMIAAQNGSKRIIKLCLQRGCSIDMVNLNGQSACHFAYGYGYAKVGEYLVSKGADDSLKNADGLTCYEGLNADELNLL
jgi:ankyrin repeat protein